MARRRVTVQDAAEALGISVDAARQRIRRGQLERAASEDPVDNRVYVWLTPDQTESRPNPEVESSALISAKDETIALLRTQLEAERQAHSEARRLLMAALERIPPQLEPPGQPAPREEPETFAAHPGRAETAERAERVDSQRVDPDIVEPESSEPEPERVEPQKSPASPGPGDTPTDTTDTGGGRETATERRWWKFWR